MLSSQGLVDKVSAVAPPRSATILLVEDDRMIRRYLEAILRRARFEVTPASDGLEAMKLALSATVDAVVTDAMMPNLNGYELCRFLRRHPKLKELPIILLSGTSISDEQCDAEVSVNAHLIKPVRADELTSCIQNLLAQTR